MKLIEILTYIDFKTRSQSFSNLSNEEILSVIDDYYNNELTVSGIKLKYSVNFKGNSIRNELPKLNFGDECRFCKTRLYVLLPTKTDYQNLLKKNNLVSILETKSKCVECGHLESDSCTCFNCTVEKRNKIFESYNQSVAIESMNFNLLERLQIATIMQGFNLSVENPDILSNEEFYHKSRGNQLLFFSNSYPKEEIKKLRDIGVVHVSPRSPIDAFLTDSDIKREEKYQGNKFPEVFYTNKVRYSFQFNDIDWFEELKFLNNVKVDEIEIIRVCKYIAENELLKLFKEHFESYHFEYKSSFSNESSLEQENLIRTVIKNLLAKYPPSKVYHILYKGIDKAVQHKKKYGITNFRDNHIQFVIFYGINSWLKYNENNISDFDFPWFSTKSLITKLFVDRILQDSNWFYTLIPVPKIEIIENDFLEYFKSLSNENRDSLLKRLYEINRLIEYLS
ncbi:hypothetical protein HPA88_07910 [Streptococcus suis]|nr:hypothetical protein [Streptococcus suis]NRG71616.1 hypothetical protein [Streptococcus suis]NRH08370.1 hypothetical protein [Streptococcus suis]